jgi:hypothetical protein
MRTHLIWIALALPLLAGADSVKLYRDDVIPVVMKTELNFKTTQEGDTFTAEVADSKMLPQGSKIEGVVNRIEQKQDKRPAFMDIEFTTIILPDGHRTDFHGTPIALSKDYVTRDKYGRWEAKKGVKKETVVLGATAGGLILGSLIHKPFEGAFIGALLGILGAETDKDHIGDGDIVVPKGSKVGARVDEDLAIQFDGRWDNNGSKDAKDGYDKEGYNSAGYDRSGYDRKGRYDAKYDTTKGNSDDFNSAGFDKYGYDRDGRYNARYDTTRTAREQGRDRKAAAVGEIEIDGKTMTYRDDVRPYRHGWIVMVPLRSTGEQLGFRVSKDDSDNTYRLESDSNVLVLEHEGKGYSLNNQRGSLPTEIEVKDGVAYAPIDTFTMLVKGSVYVNGTKYRPGT